VQPRAYGYALTISARKPDTLAQTATALGAKGYEVVDQAANVKDEDALKALVELYRERYGHLDVLVNDAGVGIGATPGEHETKKVDMQLDVNVRSIILMYRECLDLLKAAGAQFGKAVVVSLASIAGKGASALAVGLFGDERRKLT